MRHPWTRDELLVAFNLYCKTPFGRLHSRNPDIIRLATQLHRTASAVAMKLVNFASLDPAQQRRNVSGLRNASQGDRNIFAEFSSDWERLAVESERAAERLVQPIEESRDRDGLVEFANLTTEREQTVRVRLVQRFFRGAVLASYGYRCAICRIAVAELLNASHIIPWSADVMRRADPTNGIAMCALHDRAFDRGFIAVSDDFRIIVSRGLISDQAPELQEVGLIRIAGEQISLPDRFRPDASALRFHRTEIFSDG